MSSINQQSYEHCSQIYDIPILSELSGRIDSDHSDPPILLRFIQKPFIELAVGLKNPRNVGKPNNATRKFVTYLNQYIRICMTKIVNSTEFKDQITDKQMKDKTYEFTDLIMSRFFDFPTPDEVKSKITVKTQSQRAKSLFLNDFENDLYKIDDIFKYIIEFKETFNEMENRNRHLIRHLIDQGIVINEDDIKNICNKSENTQINYSILFGKINEYANQRQRGDENQDCTKSRYETYVKHVNCIYIDRNPNESELENVTHKVQSSNTICYLNDSSLMKINDLPLKIEDDEVVIDNHAFNKLNSNTTGIIRLVPRETLEWEHSAKHNNELLMAGSPQVVTAPKCEILLKFEEEICKLRPAYTKFSDTSDPINLWFGILMTIDKFEREYDILLSKDQMSKIKEMRDQIEPCLEIWEQAKKITI